MHLQQVQPAAGRHVSKHGRVGSAAHIRGSMNRAAAYRRLAITILGLDVATLAAEICADRTRDTRRLMECQRSAVADGSPPLDRAPEPNNPVAA